MRPSEFQHTAARRRLDRSAAGAGVPCVVSTHSRPKAAGRTLFNGRMERQFQHTAARRRLVAIRKVLE